MADPHTIRFNTESVGGGPLGVQPAVPQTGVQGGGNTGATTVRRGADWFQNVGGMETDFGGNLPEFVKGLTEPAMEARRTQQMWEGFAAARSGQQMEEITESQPWYTRIFGPTNYEIGAQHFHVQKQAADVEADIIRRMPELRQLTSQEMARELQRISQESLMGNAYADSLLQKMLMERAGPIMDLHTKERVSWENHEQLRLQVDAATTQSAAFQAIMERTAHLGEDHPDFLEAAERQQESKLILADTLTTSRYQTDESRYAFYRAVALHAAQNGHFYTLRALEEFGLQDALNIEQQEDLISTVNAAKRQFKANLPIDNEFVRMRSEWKVESALGLMSAEQSLEMAHAINDRWSARTGDTEGFIQLDGAESVAGSALGAYHRAMFAQEQERRAAAAAADTEHQRELLRQQQVTRDTEAWIDGGLGQLVNTGITTRDNAETIAISSYDADPAQALQAAVRQYGFPNHQFVSERVKTAVQQSIPTDPQSEWTPGIGRAFAAFKVMENTVFKGAGGVEDTMTGRNAAREYFGDRNVMLFRQYEVNLGRGMDERMAWANAQQSLSDMPRGRGELTNDQYELVQEQLKKPNLFMRALTGDQGYSVKGVLLSSAVREFPLVQRANPDWDDERVAQAAVQAARAKNIDTAGEFNWLRPEGTRAISSYGGEVDPMVYSVALRQYIDKQVENAGIKMTDDTEFFMHRQQDRDGFPVLQAWVYDARTGNQVQVDFTRPDFEKVQAEALEMEKQQMDAADQHLFYGGRGPAPRRN